MASSSSTSAVGERDAVLRAVRAPLGLELTRDEDPLGARGERRCVHVVDELVDVRTERRRAGRNRVTSSTTKLAPLATRSQPVSSDSLCSVVPKLLSASTPRHDLDQEADAEALVPAEPLQLRDRRRVADRWWGSRARRSPSPREWSRRRACGPAGSCCRPRRWWRCRRRCRGAGRRAPRTRTGWSRTGSVVPPNGGTIVAPFWNAIAKHPAADARIV